MCRHHQTPNIFIPKRETWPPDATLRDDIRNYSFHKKLPPVTFISCMREGRAPLVLQGFLLAGNAAFSILGSEGESYPLRLKTFQSENDELIQKRNNRTFFPELTFDKDSDKAQLLWKGFRDYRHSYSGKEFIKDWIGGLILLHASATRELLRVLLKSRLAIREALVSNEPFPFKKSSRTGMYWIWWSCSKPPNLAEWVKHCWDQTLDFNTMQLVLREYHPMNSGFYRTWMNDSIDTEDGLSVLIFWMVPQSCSIRSLF